MYIHYPSHHLSLLISFWLSSAVEFVIATQDPWVPRDPLLKSIERYFGSGHIVIHEWQGGHVLPEESSPRAIRLLKRTLDGHGYNAMEA